MKDNEKEQKFTEKCYKAKLTAHTNMKNFWEMHGRDTINEFSEQIKCWPRKKVKKKETRALLQHKLESSPILLITANRVEANMMVRRLSEVLSKDGEGLQTITEKNCKFHFGTIAGKHVVHVQPKDMSSFTRDGSFSTIEFILKRYKPQLVVSVGVAFGADAEKQNLGDVIVSKRLLPYDSSNKYSDGRIKLNGPLYETNSQLLCSWMDLLEYEKFPGTENADDEGNNRIATNSNGKAEEKTHGLEAGIFNWYTGTVLSGGSVVDEVEQKVKLFEAAANRGIDDVVGGEMEGSGIYFACDKEKIPCIVIKGICDWGVNKNAWDEILKDVDNRPDNNTVKDCIQALAFNNAFSALRCLLEYDSTMISEVYDTQDEENIPTNHLFNMKSLERGMMKISTINFLPYLFLGTVYSLISFLYEPVLFRFFNGGISSERMESIIWWSLAVIFVSLVVNGVLVGHSRLKRRYKTRPIVLELFPIIIFLEVNIFLFFVISYIKLFVDISDAEIGNIVKYFQFIYSSFLALSAIVWSVAKHFRTRPENLKEVFANIVFKNLSFEKCYCILENTSQAELYSMSIGWICKTQLSPVKIHKCEILCSGENLLITSQNCTYIREEIRVFEIPKDFCSIVPDTLQVNYRMPNGDLVIHIITKALRGIIKRESLEEYGFCTRYSERVLIYRDGAYEEVLKRTCYSQIIDEV